MSAAIPAATLVVFREFADAPPELLILERAPAMAFAAGALVFPGGRIDAGDYVLAERHDGHRDENAARIAAIRETVEEAGLAIGLVPSPPSDTIAAMRTALHAGEDFGALLSDAGITLDLAALVPFARWLPDHPQMRIFDARFYLARLPTDAPAPTVDATENVRLFWASAASVLTDADAGTARIIYPTRRNLERLAQFATFDAAVTDARAHPVRTITPVIEDRDGVPHLCIPDDLGYPVTAEAMRAAVRG